MSQVIILRKVRKYKFIEGVKMFGELFKLGEDLVKVAVAPVEVALDVTRVVTKPLADVATSTVETVKDLTKDITK